MEPSVLSRSRMMGKKTVNSRRIMAAVMVIVMLAALTGCVGKEDTQTRKKNKVVEIPMILTVDSSTGNKNEEEVVERFNRHIKEVSYRCGLGDGDGGRIPEESETYECDR